jgi:hypothetical protein
MATDEASSEAGKRRDSYARCSQRVRPVCEQDKQWKHSRLFCNQRWVENTALSAHLINDHGLGAVQEDARGRMKEARLICKQPRQSLMQGNMKRYVIKHPCRTAQVLEQQWLLTRCCGGSRAALPGLGGSHAAR